MSPDVIIVNTKTSFYESIRLSDESAMMVSNAIEDGLAAKAYKEKLTREDSEGAFILANFLRQAVRITKNKW